DRCPGDGKGLPGVLGLANGCLGLGFGSGGHRVASCSWNRLMLMTRIGVTTISRITARAAPRPSLALRKNSVIILSATTEVPSAPPVITQTMSNTFQFGVRTVVQTTTMVQRIVGPTSRR